MKAFLSDRAARQSNVMFGACDEACHGPLLAVCEARAVLAVSGETGGDEWDRSLIPAYKVCWPKGCSLPIAQSAIMASAEYVLAAAEAIRAALDSGMLDDRS